MKAWTNQNVLQFRVTLWTGLTTRTLPLFQEPLETFVTRGVTTG